MDQATLAERVGVSRWWINEIERGKPRAELGLVLQTLTVLGVALSVDELPGGNTTPGRSLDDVLARARGKRS